MAAKPASNPSLSWLARILLYPFSLLYRVGMWLRNKGYDLGLLRSRSLPLKVISIGNISMGGTGKTVLALFLLKQLRDQGLQAAYLSRGYGRKTKGFRLVDARQDTALTVGDEALMVAHTHPDLPVAVCEDRHAGGAELLRRFPDLQFLILDDGFQHRAIARDLDIVVIDATTPPWKDSLLPYGHLREPSSNLQRADLVVVNKILEEGEIQHVRRSIHPHVCFAQHRALGFVPFDGREMVPIEDFVHAPCVLFTAVGNNWQVAQQVGRLGLSIVRHYAHRDHKTFKKSHIQRAIQHYERTLNNKAYVRDAILLTTEKDYNRMRTDEELMALTQGHPFYYLRIEFGLLRGEELFTKAFNKLGVNLRLSASN